jgi:hypothetical protein
MAGFRPHAEELEAQLVGGSNSAATIKRFFRSDISGEYFSGASQKTNFSERLTCPVRDRQTTSYA